LSSRYKILKALLGVWRGGERRVLGERNIGEN